jgi:carbonic anhydrase/acetyltransferase-like protein (isoleucine patch superfamily)
MIADDARIDPTSDVTGWALVARGADIRSGALVANSAILPGAVVGEGAVVARSVVPPGAYVPPGALVVDRVFASLESNERLQT